MDIRTDWQPMCEVTIRGSRVQTRRAFLRKCAALPLVSGALGLTGSITQAADSLRRQGKGCILLWMQGGPSQFETFAPKPGHANGGDTKAISTNVPGIELAENLPAISQVMSKICLVRSMTSKEGSHPRATYLMRTGYLPQASVKYPALGAQVGYHLGDAEFDLPVFVRIGRGNAQAKGGFLGVDYDPFLMSSATRKPDNTQLGTGADRFQKRLGLMGRLERQFDRQGGQVAVRNHRKLYQQASKMVLSSRMAAFDLDLEPANLRAAYGEGETAAALLMARRLVEAGVPFVEVNLGNWDTHDDNFNRTKALCQQMDQPLATLLRDLDDRGMLDQTLVMCAGEFGRTPRINARGGRDHYPRAFSVALAGCGVRGRQVIGATDPGGVEVVDDPVRVPDLFRTVFHALGIDADQEYVSNIGRPIKAADEGHVVEQVFRG